MKEALILDFKILSEQNISLIEFITLLKLNYNQIDYIIEDNVLHSLQEKQFIKIIKDNEETVTILREKSKLLIDFLLIEGLNSDYKQKKINKKSTRVIENDLDQFIYDYRQLWKGLKVGSMGSENSCKDKMIRWMKENPRYSKQDILKSARIYLKSVNDYTYLQAADYFIFKKDGKEESSRLSAFIDETEQINTDWTSRLS